MKKISLIVLFSAILLMSVFGDNPSAEFVVGTYISELTGLIVHDNSTNYVTYPTDMDSWASLNPIGTSDDPVWLGQDDDGGSQDTYRVVAVSAMTNKAGNFKVTATVGPMVEADDPSKKIGFTVTVNGVATTVAKGDSPKDITLIASIPDVSELTFVTEVFRIDIDPTDYNNAVMGLYTSTWAIELTTV